MFANPRLLLACAAMVTLAGCGTPAATAPSPAPAASATLDAAFGGTDRSWIEINIAMDEELIPLLALTAANSDDPAVRELATQVRAVIDEELATLRTLHTEAGLPSENPHKGMPMPGMVTPEQVTEAAANQGPAFDAILRECLRAHLRQSRQLADSEQKAGTEPRTVALAERISANRELFLKKL
ncbi:DUF305 domain-containing protein [Actinoplanes sp. NPDC024001]|uniref:DUF305 domain-containing protein n=1 Tax=Actinoplanes sp. NPDC024001 TaxID=3154598 RepID=UPI0033F645E9